MSPRDQDLVSTVPHTGPAVYTKPVLRSTGSVAELNDELSESFDSSDDESVGPAEEAFSHTKEATSTYLGLATDYLASFKAAQLGLKAADGVLDTLDRATRCEDDCKEVDCVESLPVQKFGDMNFDTEVYNSEGDSDYCPSEDCEDCEDLEYDSEAEVSDAEAEVVCEKAKANTYVQSLQRQCRAVRRAGTKRAGTDRPVHTIGEASLVGAICETFNINFFLSVVGLKLEPINKRIFKQVTDTAEEDEDHTEVAFSQLNLKGYDSAEDADYCPGDSEEDSDLEYDSEAEISEESDQELHTEEVELPFDELDFEDYVSEEDPDYCPSESDDELETYTKPVLRSSAAKLNNGLNMKDFEEDAAYNYDSDESDSSEESDEEVSEEVPTQMFGEINFDVSGEDSAYCPGEAEKYLEAKTFKLVLRNSASAAGINTGLIFKDYEEDVDYSSSESEEEDSDSDTEVSEESDEELHNEVEMAFYELNFEGYVSEEDPDYCPTESDDVELVTFAKPVLRNSASAAEINTGLTFQDYEEDVNFSSSDSEDSEYDSDTEVSEETDED